MTRRIKVLTVIDSLGVGGAESLLPIFLRHVDREQFDISVLALYRVAPNHVLDAVARECPDVVQWPGRRLISASRVRAIAQRAHHLKVDLVHTHLLYSNVQGSTAARFARLPHVATLHNLHPAWRKIDKRAKWTLEVAALRANASRVIAVADEVARSYTGHLGVNPAKVTMIPNAIDLQRFSNVSPAAAARTRAQILGTMRGPLIVAIGRVGAMKGFDVLVHAAARLVQDFPELRVVIAGRDADDANVVRDAIASNGLHETVRLVGQRDDVPELLSAADVFVLSSLWEGAPIALLEAMATGTPVVASNVGGVPEVIRDGENGLLVNCGDPDDLARGLRHLLRNRAAASTIGLSGRDTVQQYGADQWARQIEAIYRSVTCRASVPVGNVPE